MAEQYPSPDEPPFVNKKSGSDEFYVTVLNAWRQERTVAEKLKQEKINANAQVSDLNSQIENLSEQLKSEKLRVKAANKLVKKMVTDFQTQTGKRDVFVEEKRRMEEKIHILETQLTALETTNRKFESSLSTTSYESLQLEKRLTEERQKISALRVEKKHLSEKVSELENTIAAKNIVIKELDKLAVELQEQLSMQTIQTAAAELDERFTQLSYEDLKDKQDNVTTCVRRVVSERSILIERIVILENCLKKREAEINYLASNLDDKTTEIVHLKSLLDKNAQQQADWLDMAIIFVSNVTRLPWCLYDYLFANEESDSTARSPSASCSGST